MPQARILIAEDDESTGMGLAEWLEGEGYSVRVVKSFEDGVNILRANPPDLLIADIRLGSFNGLQLVIRAHSAVPAIVITGYDDPVLAENARSFGAAYFVKPIDSAAVLATIARAIGASKESSQSL